MKKLISVLLIAVLSLGVLASCGDGNKETGTVKEIKSDTYVDRFIAATKEQVKDSKGNEIEIAEPTVEEEKGEKYDTTTITYGEEETLEIFSNPETNEINGANLRIYSPSATREADLERFFALTEVLLRQSDPTITDEQVKDAIEKFKNAVPDDPTAEGYTGMCTYTVEINGLSYLAFYDFTTDPASCEILLS